MLVPPPVKGSAHTGHDPLVLGRGAGVGDWSWAEGLVQGIAAFLEPMSGHEVQQL